MNHTHQCMCTNLSQQQSELNCQACTSNTVAAHSPAAGRLITPFPHIDNNVGQWQLETNNNINVRMGREGGREGTQRVYVYSTHTGNQTEERTKSYTTFCAAGTTVPGKTMTINDVVKEDNKG